MDRRGPARLILALFVALVSVLAPASTTSADVEPPQATQPDNEPTSAPADGPDVDRPIPTVSDFYPEDSNLSDCLGLVERPGCGSKARGGWRQATVFVALIAGLGVVFWRISVGVRRNRIDPSAGDRSPDDRSPDDRSPDDRSPDDRSPGDRSPGDRSPDTDESRA